ncbi:hypothetical protein QM012_007609 [Aureobasidium pullulans]|uniref:FAD/NAD(P)-binding domain-containing protein n=1 Tax=Aureobasidium pullulans TaxID=5580 RepID=A0ABR0TK46_AURPU
MSEKKFCKSHARNPRIAIIGAGITGVSAACEVIGHGLDCQIFEAGDETSVGGIWTRQNRHSSLQVPSDFYRFHPEVEWSCLYPGREEILEQTRLLWNRFNLQPRTTFSCPVTQINRVDQGYIINDDSHGYFDSIIVAVGTCAQISRPHLSGQEGFQGEIFHSSEMDDADLEGKDVVVLGGGASAVEALEHAYNEKAATIHVVSRV